MKSLRNEIADTLRNNELLVMKSTATRLELADMILEVILKDNIRNKDRQPETKEEKTTRLLESHNHLYKSMIKFGCYCKAHDELFKEIQLELDALIKEEPNDT